MELKNYKEMYIRWLILVLGICLMGFGVSLSIKANLGTSSISCIPYILSLQYTILTVGEFTILFNSLFFLLQIIILKNDFKIIQVLQMILVVIFGFIIDFFLFLENSIIINNYLLSWLICILGILTLALGVFLAIKSEISTLPVDGFVFALSKYTNIEFSKLKVINDVSIVLTATILSLIFFNTLIGVREGTVATAIFIGIVIKFYKRIFESKIDNIINRFLVK